MKDMIKPDIFPKRFLKKIEVTPNCWLWKTGKFKGGYGQYWSDGRGISAHRYSWICAFGQIPKGLSVLHKCDNPRCVNPNHLFLGTTKDNSIDMVSKNRAATGERNGNSKINWEIANQIRNEYRPGKAFVKSGKSIAGLALKYGLGTSAVHSIVKNKTWTKRGEKIVK